MLFSMLAGVSLYFIYHLSRFNQITQSIILNDTSILEYSNQLSDVLLLESRYDRKFVVLKDEALHESYLQAKNVRNFGGAITGGHLNVGDTDIRRAGNATKGA